MPPARATVTLTLDQSKVKLPELRDDSAHSIASFEPNAFIRRHSEDYTAGGPREDDVTRQQSHERGRVRNETRAGKDHVRRVHVLARRLFIVHERLHLQCLRVRDLVGGY